MNYSKVQTGQKGELLAREYLQEKGYLIVETNYRQKLGEIDIIVIKNETIAFVEVRTKTSLQFGTAAESITNAKKHKIIKVAQYYLTGQRKDIAYRFDVITVFLDKSSVKIEHYENAF